MSLGEKAVGKLPGDAFAVHAEDAGIATRALIMVVIFVVSLAAVSLPTITETYRSIRVPSLFFFIGKHFGTGVILSTAFVHLLQDAFKALQDREVNERWRVGQWSGMIVLGSLLAIFLVEYVSTAFVDRLQSYPSAPSSPTASVNSSRAPSIQIEYDASAELPPSARPSILVQSPHGTKFGAEGTPIPHKPDTRQVGEFDEAGHPSAAPLPLAPPELADETADGPHKHASSEVSPLSSSALPPRTASRSYGSTVRTYGRPTGRPRAHTTHISAPVEETFFSGGHHRHETRGSHSTHHARVPRWSLFGIPWFTSDDESSQPQPAALSRSQSTRSLISGRRSTAHSHGATSHSHGHGHGDGGHAHHHAHPDMERWMDGMADRVRGAAAEDVDADECGSEGGDEELKIGRRRQVIAILVLQMGIMIHSLVIGLTLSITSGPEFTSLVIAIVFHQLFEGLSLGIRIAGLPSKQSEAGFKHLSGRTLKPLLALTFAITTPLGIGIGLAALSGAKSTGPRLMLVQGVMSAISAGMLIYAACVEMLAGDFVMDAHLWRSSVRRQVLALVSLFAGVAAMAAIGFLD